MPTTVGYHTVIFRGLKRVLLIHFKGLLNCICLTALLVDWCKFHAGIKSGVTISENFSAFYLRLNKQCKQMQTFSKPKNLKLIIIHKEKFW